jgi:NDP-sugar pyrophosphorylase family protein
MGGRTEDANIHAKRDPLPTVCILAGGLGTRLGKRVRDVPKPLLEVAGEPFLVHQLRRLATHNARRVVICVGYRGEAIVERIGETQFGIDISYSHDDPGLSGTLGAIRKAAPLLGERFLILYGDAYLRADYAVAAEAWRRSGLPALMTVLRNEGRWDASNVLYRAGRVIAYDKHAPTAAMRWIDYGLGGLEARALSRIPASERDLASLYGLLAQRRELCGFAVSTRFYEIGTPAALAETEDFLSDSPDRCEAPGRRERAATAVRDGDAETRRAQVGIDADEPATSTGMPGNASR